MSPEETRNQTARFLKACRGLAILNNLKTMRAGRVTRCEVSGETEESTEHVELAAHVRILDK